MRKKPILKLSYFWIMSFLVILVLQISCKPKTLPHRVSTATIFSNWFISPSPHTQEILDKENLSFMQIDSLVLFIKQKFKTIMGPCSTTIYDSASLQYSLGWKPPSKYTPDSLYPLVIYLHGGTGTQRTDKGTTAYAMLSQLADSMPLFLASPSSNRDAPFWSTLGQYRIMQTIRCMKLWYSIDPERIFLVGVSDGGTACFATASLHYEPFAGFIAISGFGGMLPQLSIALNVENLRQRPIYNVTAGNDRLYPASQTLDFLNWLKANNVFVEAKLYPLEEHGFDYRAQEIPNILNKIRTWKKPKVTPESEFAKRILKCQNSYYDHAHLLADPKPNPNLY